MGQPINDGGHAPLQPKRIVPASMTVKLASFGIGSVLIAVNLMGNSLMFAHEGQRGAGSLTTSFQALLLGVCGGALMGVGQMIGKPIGQQNFELAGQKVSAAYAMTAILTGISTLAYGLTYFVFPAVAPHATAEAASTYFLVSALGNWPALALVTMGQVAFQMGDWVSPLASSAVYRLLSVAVSYLLSAPAGLNAVGIGLGNLIAPWVSYLGMHFWLKKRQFAAINSTPLSKEIVKEHLKPSMQFGGKMSLQRVTEWGNLAIITAVLGAMSGQNLVAINPSLQFMTLFNLFSQGIGLAGSMIVTPLLAKRNTVIETGDRSEENKGTVAEAHAHIKSAVTKSVVSGIVVNGALAVALFFARKPIVDFFLSDSVSKEAHEVAQTALWINGIGLVTDAVRIITGTLLNSWEKLYFQNIVAILTMTVVGVPLGWVLGKQGSDENAVLPMFAMRTGMIFLAALINSIELYRTLKADDRQVQQFSTPGLAAV